MTNWITYPSSATVARGARSPGMPANVRRAPPGRITRILAAAGSASVGAVVASMLALGPAAAATDTRPLSAAQVELFETPHLQNIDHPETLEYRFQREGAGGFSDTIAERIEKIHADGTKYVDFDFLTGAHHVFFPAIDNFHANPLLMLFLERDVREMQAATGVATGYFRHRIREAFVDRAHVSDIRVTVDGKPVDAKRITLQPFLNDQHLTRLPAIKGKTYTFVLSDQVPGMLDELSAAEPVDASTGTGKLVERITFTAEKPLGAKP